MQRKVVKKYQVWKMEKENLREKEENLLEMSNKARCERGEVPPSLPPDTPLATYCLFSVQCTLYSVQCTVYTIQCTLHSVHYTVYTVQCTLYSIQCTVYSVQHTLYKAECTLYNYK